MLMNFRDITVAQRRFGAPFISGDDVLFMFESFACHVDGIKWKKGITLATSADKILIKPKRDKGCANILILNNAAGATAQTIRYA